MATRDTPPQPLSRLYHLNSEPWVQDTPGPAPQLLQRAKSYPQAAQVPLPAMPQSATDRQNAARRSVRAFSPAPLTLAALAAVLRSGYDAIGPDPMADGQRMLRRPVPSAGGLYPLEIFVLAQAVSGLEVGIYHYDPVGDGLAAIKPGPWQDAAAGAFLSWDSVQTAPAILCLGAVFDRTESKYGPRGYRYILFEAGHVGQNMTLRATEDRLATLFLGGFYDSRLNATLGLDGVNEAAVYAMALGQPVGKD